MGKLFAELEKWYLNVIAQVFGTHAAVKELVVSGFSEQQAEAITAATRKLAETELATEGDVVSLKAKVYTVALLIVGLNTVITFGFMH